MAVKTGKKNVVKKSAHKACAWLSTKQGEDSIDSVIRKGTPFSDGIEKARNIDQKVLRQPLDLF